jgi:glutaminyl-tRNA synthetase
MRRRGYPPAAIREFCKRVGVTRREKRVELKALEHAVREELNRTSPRAMAVLDPLRMVIENYPEGQTEHMEAVNNPEDPSAGTRKVPFSRVVYIEREDFREDPPRKFFRMAPGREVRLRYAYLVVCTGAIKDENGEVVELRCTYDPATKGGDAPDGRKVKGTLHWVSAEHAVDARVRLLEPLFLTRDPEENGDFRDDLNPESLVVRDGCKLEPGLADPPPGTRVQFERQGYFCADPDSAPGRPVWNRTVPLRDSWAKIEKQQSQQAKARR